MSEPVPIKLSAMRNLIPIFCLLFVITASCKQVQTDEQLVNSFVKEWISSAGSKACALKYLNIHESQLQDKAKKKFFFEWFSYISKCLNEEIVKNNGRFLIIPHQNNQENKMIKEFNLITDDYGGVFYVVTDSVVVTSIIVKNGKVISFCPILNQGNKINRPWFINEKY